MKYGIAYTDRDGTPVFYEDKIELHLSPISSETHEIDLPRRWGHRIRELGGEYSEARGASMVRYVKLPASPAGIALAATLVREYHVPGMSRESGAPFCTTAVARPGRGYDLSRVVYLRTAAPEPQLAWMLGYCRGVSLATLLREDDRREQQRIERPAKLREERDRLRARLAEVERELAELDRPRIEPSETHVGGGLYVRPLGAPIPSNHRSIP